MADITQVPLSKRLTQNKYILAITITTVVCLVFLTVAAVYDMGVKQGQIGALKTAYEVCKKVAPLNDNGEGCK